jgi:serine/threonine-protein kinase
MSADPNPNPPAPFFPEVTSLVGRVVLGRYRVVRPIGRGGMGIVYLARNEGAAGFVKPVVIKQTLPHLSDANALIPAREARIMSNLRHPGIVDVLDFAEEDGSYLLVIDYVHGYNMAQWNRFLRSSGRFFSWEIVCHVMANVLDALHYAHTLKGPNGEKLEVVHRDVSPSNVLVDISGHVKLADFGVARMQNEQTEGSQEKGLKGKISYIAPELLQLEAPTPLSDVYACGVVLHELLIGKNEMRGDGVAGTSLRTLFHELSPPSGSRTDLPIELDTVVAKAVAKDKALRYPTAHAFAQALRGLQKMSEGELTALLATSAASDFRDPQMAGQLGSCDLSTLDRAWREAPITGSLERVKAPSSGDATTKNPERESVTVAALDEQSGPRRQEPKSWWRLAVSVGAVAAAATAFFVLKRPQAPAGPEPILLVQTPVPVDSSRNAAGEVDTLAHTDSLSTGSEGAAAAAPSTTPATRARLAGSVAPSSARQSPADAISRTFAQKRGLVAQCFTDHPTDNSGAPMAVHFQIDEKGNVLSAKLLPAELAGTQLAACIERVARSTVFGPQREAISFRVPITARRVP